MGCSTLGELVHRTPLADVHPPEYAPVEQQLEGAVHRGSGNPFALPQKGKNQVLRGEMSLHGLDVVHDQFALARMTRYGTNYWLT